MSKNHIKTTTNSSGVGFLSMLTVLFIGLKLTDVIDWSWWYVLLPLYGPFAFLFGLVLFASFVAGIVSMITWVFK